MLQKKKKKRGTTFKINEGFKTWTNESSQHPEAGNTRCAKGFPNSGCPISRPIYSWRLLQMGIFLEHPNKRRDTSSAHTRSISGRQKGMRVMCPPSSSSHHRMLPDPGPRLSAPEFTHKRGQSRRREDHLPIQQAASVPSPKGQLLLPSV